MLNYLSAELWRVSRRRQNRLGGAVFLLLVAIVGFIWGGGGFGWALEGFEDFLLVGLYLGFPLSALTCGDLWRSGTLRNEVSAGLPRSRVYLGKLLCALIIGVLLFLATALVFLLAALPSTAGTPLVREEVQAAWANLRTGVLAALPRYMGAVALAQCLCFTFRAGGLAPVLYYLYITLGELFVSAVHFTGLGPVGDGLNVLAQAARPYLLSSLYFSYGGNAPLPVRVPGSWLVGLGWIAVTSLIGITIFSRREIK